MKHLRVFILVLLAVLLPVRGAMAATMLCPPGEDASSAVGVTPHDHHDTQPDHDMPADHAAHHHNEDVPDDASPSGEHPATCHLCASGCCMASIVGTVPALGPPGLTWSVTYPAFTAPAPAFHSGGPDRPPRTS